MHLTTLPDQNSQAPLTHLWLELTGRCNLECVHCYSDSGPSAELRGVMTTPKWLALMDDAVEQGCRSVQLIGGEPMAHPDFDRILEHAGRTFDHIEVFTNATMLTPAKIAQIKAAGATIATSIYSDTAAIHDAVTLRKGSFAKTIGNIKNAVAAGIPVRAGIIQTDNNAGQDFHQVMGFLKGIGIENVGLDGTRSVGRGSVNANRIGSNPAEAMCGKCFDGSLCATFNGKLHPCIMSKFIDLGHVSDGLEHALQRKDQAEAELGPKYGIDAVCYPGQECFPRVCEPQGAQCLPINCIPHCGPRCVPI
jgi:sulfatase maturation enzyme AslB (radical SAM superfamily)